MKKLLLSLFVVMALTLSFAACKPVSQNSDPKPESESVVVETVLTAKTEMTLEVGESANLDATVTPETDLTYTSSDDTVATVDEDGLVTAIAEGVAEITVRAGGESVKCVVTVPHVYTYEIMLAQEEYQMFVGDEMEVAYAITVDGNEYTLVDGDSVNLSVDDMEIAIVEDGSLKGVAIGDATLTVTAVVSGKTVVATAQVSVVESANIQFLVNGELSNPVKCAVGEKIQRPETPALAGHEFYGWFVDETPFDFDAGITEDTVVTAVFAEISKLVASDEAAVTFENSWIQSLTTYTHTDAFKVEGEAGSTMISSDFEGAWCEPKLGDFSFTEYNKIYFSFGFDKAANISFNTGDENYAVWLTVVPGTVYTCIIEVNENPGHVNVYLKGAGLDGDLWYYNLEWSNLNDRAFTHTTKGGENKVTMFLGAIWGVKLV